MKKNSIIVASFIALQAHSTALCNNRLLLLSSRLITPIMRSLHGQKSITPLQQTLTEYPDEADKLTKRLLELNRRLLDFSSNDTESILFPLHGKELIEEYQTQSEAIETLLNSFENISRTIKEKHNNTIVTVEEKNTFFKVYGSAHKSFISLTTVNDITSLLTKMLEKKIHNQ